MSYVHGEMKYMSYVHEEMVLCMYTQQVGWSLTFFCNLSVILVLSLSTQCHANNN